MWQPMTGLMESFPLFGGKHSEQRKVDHQKKGNRICTKLFSTLKIVFPEIIHIKVTSKCKALNIKTIKQTWHVWSEMYKNTAIFKGVNVLIYVSRAPQGFFVWSVVQESLWFPKWLKELSNRQECTIPSHYIKGSEIYNTWKRIIHLNGKNMLKPID